MANNNIPHLNLKFYPLGQTPVLPTDTNADKGNIAFDHTLGRIGANGKWFGDSSDKLPLAGGTLTGNVILANDTHFILNDRANITVTGRTDRPVISWVNRNSRDAIEIGNTSMHLRLSTGSGGNLYHYYQNGSTSYEARILDAYNTGMSDYTQSNIQYGYTLTLPEGLNGNANSSNSYNLLGVGYLDPKISVDNNGQIKITVGGEESEAAPLYASSFVGNNYFSYDNNSKYLYHLLGANASIPIEIGNGIKVDKIVHTNPNTNEEYSGSDANRPGNYHLKISIDPSIISRIEALENRINVSFDEIS